MLHEQAVWRRSGGAGASEVLERSKEQIVVEWMHDRGVTSGHMYATAAAHVAAVAVLWVRAERSGDATRQRRAMALSLCPPIYQLWGIALKLEETRA